MESKHMSWLSWAIVLAVVLLATCVLALAVGPVRIPLSRLLDILLGRVAGSSDYAIFYSVRLPRILLGVSVGGALAISGVILQGTFRNPLVEPYTLGISGGAALGVSLNIIAGGIEILGPLSLPFGGFVGAAGMVATVYALTTRGGTVSLSRLLLIGVMVSFMASSLIMLIMALTKVEDLRGIIFWIMGSLEEPHLTLITLVSLLSLGGVLLSLFFAVDLNALSLGEEDAFHLGVNVERMKKVFFLIASCLTGACVSVAGIIGFVGLVVPHLMRLLVGSDHRILLVVSYLSGAIFLVLCDTLARVIIAPLELPVGVITGLLGGGIFIYVLSKRGAWL